jgi:hypothetical protein
LRGVLTLHLKLSAFLLPGRLLLAQPSQFLTLGLAKRATLTRPLAVELHPVMQRVGADPQVPRDLRDGLAGLLDDPNRSFTELRIKPASLISHDPTISLVQVSTLRGEAHPPRFRRMVRLRRMRRITP